MAIKNATSISKNTFSKIQEILAKHGARKIMFEYGQDGWIYGIAFQINFGEKEFSIRLPARIEQVAIKMYGRPLQNIDQKRREQSYRTAWANIRDWIDAQMAMIDTGMVQIGEIFLPYFVMKDGHTHFEQVALDPKFLLE